MTKQIKELCTTLSNLTCESITYRYDSSVRYFKFEVLINGELLNCFESKRELFAYLQGFIFSYRLYGKS